MHPPPPPAPGAKEDAVTAATMFELAKFERQKIGVVTRASLRIGGK